MVSDVELYGRQSKILVTDYVFGKHRLLYSSADVLTTGVFDGGDVLVLYLKEGQTGVFAFKGEAGLSFVLDGSSTVSVSAPGGGGGASSQQAFTYKQAAGTTAVQFSNGVLVYLLDQATAWRFWAPSSTVTPYPPLDKRYFIIGPYLVRNASVDVDVLRVSGDNDEAATMEAYVGTHTTIKTISWNGKELEARKTRYGSYVTWIPGVQGRTISLPSLDRWHGADSLPEADPAFDDSRWTVCNKTASLSPVGPDTLPVLFSSDYGFYSGAKVYRGYFDNTGGHWKSVKLTCSGGLGFGWSAWLNGEFIGGDTGSSLLTTTTGELALAASALKPADNVLTVLVDYHGHDETSTGQGVGNPRGILGATLLPGGTAKATGFSTWKLQGNAGGDANIDPVRGPMNEGGLYGERLGWFLPGFDPSSLNRSDSPMHGLARAGVRFYTTTFALDLDDDLDVPLGVSLSAAAGTAARVQLWVNGYQFGKFEPHVGPQSVFPVPPGIVNNRGTNTLALSLWAQEAAGARLDAVRLVSYGAYQTDFGFARDWSALQPAWTDRSEYV